MPGCARCPQPTTECVVAPLRLGVRPSCTQESQVQLFLLATEFNLGFPGTFQTTGKPESSAARCVRLLRAAWLVALPDLWLGDHAGAHQR